MGCVPPRVSHGHAVGPPLRRPSVVGWWSRKHDLAQAVLLQADASPVITLGEDARRAAPRLPAFCTALRKANASGHSSAINKLGGPIGATVAPSVQLCRWQGSSRHLII